MRTPTPHLYLSWMRSVLLTACILLTGAMTFNAAAADKTDQQMQLMEQMLNDMKKAKEQEAKEAASPKDENLTSVKAEFEKLRAADKIADVSQRPQLQKNIDHVWMLLAGILVFWMQAGFAMLEIGFTRAKNSINCAMKGILDFCSASICYLLFGFTLMFGSSSTGGFVGSFSLSSFAADSNIWSFWFFQACFASAACTIASGAMAERTKFLGYMIYTAFFSGLVYPIFGHWVWGSFAANYEPGFGGGQGWLQALGFRDFAGSCVVHAMGGACALAGIVVVGPRLGRFAEDGSVVTMPGHNIPMAFLGAFILWMGWFGFNAGSTMTAGSEIGRIAVNTCIAGSAGGFFGLILIWVLRGVPDAASTINGLLAGAVSVTASCNIVTPFSAIIIGAIGGLLCSIATVLMERWRLDDVVGAVPVHLFCGVWGTIAVGIFDEKGFSLNALGMQIFGVLVIAGSAFVAALVVFKIIDASVGLRATDDEQEMGLDFAEHATNAYPDFKTNER
jgi:ammonium transporter, Amt family